MRILLTGSAGFIGSHISMRLLAEGHELCGIDDLNDYYDVRLKKYRLEQFSDHPLFQQHVFDLSKKEETEQIFSSFRPQRVLHLAAQAGVRYGSENPHSYTRRNVEAFLNVLEGCRHNGVERLVFASSSSVYGGVKEQPFHEEMRVDSPISLYAATKKADELMAHAYSSLYDLPVVGLRFFTVYGPMGRPDMALWLFTESILAGRPIKVFNHGDMRRDFSYVDDIVDGTCRALFFDIPEKYRIYNLGNHRPESLMTLIQLLEDSLGKEAKKEFLPMQAGDVKETWADIGRAEKELLFHPETPLQKGISSFSRWYLDEWLSRVK
ncbi:MAG: NAD-dependent epimerase/dehydratase family protein [Planctomycetes bacterium]|nr:NAD-dependent epimerase/dehydratase family protein [Planctomycetota bacterium]